MKSILEYLRIKGHLCKRNNSGMAFGSHKGKKWVIRTGEAGWPDIEGILPGGKYFGIEVKTKKGVLSESQKEMADLIHEKQGIWFVARSLEDVIQKGF